MSPNPRFGFKPAPISYLSQVEDGEFLADFNNGHLYVKSKNKALSKTVENENRLDEMVKRFAYQNPQLIMGSSNWTRFCEEKSGMTVSHYVDTTTGGKIGGVRVDFAANSGLFVLKLDFPLARSLHTKYYISATVKCISGPGNVKLYTEVETDLIQGLNGDPNRGSTTGETIGETYPFKVNDMQRISTTFGEDSEFEDMLSTPKFKKGPFFKPGIQFAVDGDRTKPASYLITDFQIWQIPHFFTDHRTHYRSFDEIYAVSPNMIGTTAPDVAATMGSAMYDESRATRNIAVAYTKPLKFGLYSVGVRMKVNNITLTNRCIKLQVHRLKKKIPIDNKISATFNAADYDVIAETTFAPSDFVEKDIYKNVFVGVEYTGAKSVDDMLRVVVSFDKPPTTIFNTFVDYIRIEPVSIGAFNRRA